MTQKLDNEFEEWEKEHFTPLQLEIRNELLELRVKGIKITEKVYNKLLQLETNDLDVVIEELFDNDLYKFLELYGKKKTLSLKEYNHLLRFDIYDEFTFERLLFKSKFRRKYGFSIRLFYLLHERVGLSYRELEKISGIGKDTLNTYVNIYIEYLNINKEINELQSKKSELEIKSFELEQKL